MNKNLKNALKATHDIAGDMFPSLKTDFIRRVNKNSTLSNALRNASGMEEIQEAIEEDPIGIFTAAKQDATRLTKMAIAKSAKSAKANPFVRQKVMPLLDKTPRVRSWLKKIVYGPSAPVSTVDVSDVRCLTRRGLKLYGMLQAMDARGED